MIDPEKKKLLDQIRHECARIAALESHYWAQVENEDMQQISLGAMGAAANICTAMLLGTSPGDFAKQIQGRSQAPQAATRPSTVASVATALSDSPNSGKATATAILSPPSPPAAEAVDHWAQKVNRELARSVEAPISKIEEKTGANGLYLKIAWPNQGRGFATASVFDSTLFPFVKARLNQRTRLYLVENGKYLNVVGIRA
ncbi:MAG: hypothetical protein ACRD20_02415 [Terriglobales bacterium]